MSSNLPTNEQRNPVAAIGAQPPQYRIGVAARLAGIPVETLRVWERRYRLTDSKLSGANRRLYTVQDIERLRLLKQLVDSGNPVGSIAALSMFELLEVRSTAASFAVATGESTPLSRQTSIALVGTTSRLRWQSHFTLVGECADIDKAVESFRDVQADIVVFELQSLLGLTRESIECVKRVTDAQAVIILYRFAPGETIRQLREAGYLVAHANLDATEIELLFRRALSVQPHRAASSASSIPAPRFDAAALEALANTPSAIYCECPRHLAEILLNLGSFERYSSECIHRSPDDAELHRNLQRAAGQARARLEEALLQIVVAEGLPLPATAGK